MLQRVEHANGLVTYQSSRLPVPHAFTTRIGGVSTSPYHSLNLGVLTKGQGDANTNVSENFRRLREALGLTRHARQEVRQVHEAEVWRVPLKPVKFSESPCADAMICDHPGRMLVIRTADCVPILLCSEDGKKVAAVHAGWRGVVAGVVGQAVQQMGSGRVFAAVGPCISVKHFEVGPEVTEAFIQQGLDVAVYENHIDLAAAVVQQLAASGVAHENIDTTDRCTYADDTEFFSHRRDVTHRGLPDTGRMAAVIAVASD